MTVKVDGLAIFTDVVVIDPAAAVKAKSKEANGGKAGGAGGAGGADGGGGDSGGGDSGRRLLSLALGVTRDDGDDMGRDGDGGGGDGGEAGGSSGWLLPLALGVASDNGSDARRGGGGGGADADAAVELALRNERERRPPGHEIRGTAKPNNRRAPQMGRNQRRAKAKAAARQQQTGT